MDVKKIIAVAVIVMGVLVAGIIFSGSERNASPAMAEAASVAEVSSFNQAPDFTLSDMDGNEVSLSDFKGNIVIINFWATWCGPCRFEIPDLIDLQEKYNGDLVILGVSLDYDGPSVVPQFAERLGISYPILYGNGQIAQRYGGVTGIPTTFVIDRDMNVYKRYVGYRPQTVFEKDIQDLI
ncbi:MAG TPA: TlpA family protein disulfide reductase [Candidatus Marinimicrobia bacterium]|jgi:thiol-disulfide isomerase/thioredoxin|nr:TlpA family protein disulfide reductase [Candidatus Neomarinimicrobiota bacterium]HHZ98726.1 TlpA family protein disulfide reductase [Candidatus Neomarinimicrobiota bacterium]HIB03528.1 TlpA family protein disulfide reductase [Candidatus Neomarinimicrobiota bacterium]HIB70257.1 TlpA family protein disulfide reductase [Candidatus Neomarinimicrobiota bacterium]HIB95288.1 TlpA family protein disulfide reductase [Candidatus Neomarinimicrobiota bacterium]